MGGLNGEREASFSTGGTINTKGHLRGQMEICVVETSYTILIHTKYMKEIYSSPNNTVPFRQLLLLGECSGAGI